MPSDLSSKFAPARPRLLRRVLNIPVIRATLVLGGVFLFCVLYGKRHFFRDPGSVWYDESRAFDRAYSAWREHEARNYIKDVSEKIAVDPSHEFTKGLPNATICASFLTINRPGIEQYLDTSIASALAGLSIAERQALHLSVFFASTKPQEHSSFDKPWLRKVVDEVYEYDSVLSDHEMDSIEELEQANDGLRKAPYDYTLPLRHCEEHTKAKHFALFEDDIILADGWMARTVLGLKEMKLKMKNMQRTNDWLYLRLFNQERSTGFVSNKIGGNREPTFSAWISVGIFTGVLVVRRRSRHLRHWLDNWSLLMVCLVFTPAFVVLFFQSGKASVMPPRPGVVEEPFGCCAQALVFNKYHVDGLVEYLYKRQKEGFHDMITRDYARMHGFARWSQYPMAAQHVGSHSTIQKIETESRKVWSMAFENQSPMVLAREHGANVRQAFGDWATG